MALELCNTAAMACHHSLLFLLLLSLLFADTASSYVLGYAEHCSSSVPASKPLGPATSQQLDFFRLHGGSVIGPGYENILDVEFVPEAVSQTREKGTLAVQVRIHFERFGWMLYNYSSFQRSWSNYSDHANFHLSGFWSETSGLLCMVGTGSRTHRRLSALFKINLRRKTNISTSLAVGTLESLDDPDSPSHFQTTTLRFYAPRDYQYTLVAAPPRLESRIGCSLLREFPVWRLDREGDCQNRRCGLFPGQSIPSHNLTVTVSLGGVRCSAADGRVNLYMHFSHHGYVMNASRYSDGSANYSLPFRPPSTTLLAEGSWEGWRRLNIVACRVRDSLDQSGGTSVGSCTIGVTIEFLEFATLRNRTLAVGKIFSRGNDFDPVKIVDNNYYYPNLWEHVKYRFTRLQDARKICKEEKSKHPAAEGTHNTREFPDMWSAQDLSISMQVRDSDGNDGAWVNAAIFSIGETFYMGYHTLETEKMSSEVMKEMSKDAWRISYGITTNIQGRERNGSLLFINAEGYYYPRSGLLCLVGCTDSMDCQIAVSIQFRPTDSSGWGRNINGAIRSRRKETDPLYFKPLHFTSSNVYSKEASEALQRMDAEMVMVVLSMTLLCLLTWKQIVHAKKHPEAAASVSVLMQVLLALSLLIPLVLNFRTLLLFTRKAAARDRLLATGGWMEASEAILRMTMIIALLVQLRLLQIIWSSRSAAADRKHRLSAAESRVLLVCLPLYLILGFFIASWATRDTTPTSHATPEASLPVSVAPINQTEQPRGTFLSSIVGLILDTILLPQILLNILVDSNAKALSGVYYPGITIIRAAPHLYDAYRAYYAPAFIPETLIYADQTMGTYSAHSDILVPIVATIFAAIIFLQQKHGGRCILPQRFKILCSML